MNLDFLNIPDFNYGSWDFGLIAAGIAALFLFLYIMQGKIVDSIVAALVIGVVVSFIAIIFFNGDANFWFKYLAISIGAPFVLAMVLLAIPRLAGASKGIGSKRSATAVGRKNPSRKKNIDEDDWDSTKEIPLHRI